MGEGEKGSIDGKGIEDWGEGLDWWGWLYR